MRSLIGEAKNVIILPMATAYSEIASNKRKTYLLMFFFTLFVMVVAYIFTLALGFRTDSAIALLSGVFGFSILANIGSFYYSDKIVIALSGAKPVEKKDAPQLYNAVENLTIAAGLPMPKVYIIDDAAPNAFATGRDPNHSAVAVTVGLLEKVDRLELEGVLAHELSHVKNYDMRLMTVVVVLVGVIAWLSYIFTRMLWFGGGDREERGGNPFILIFAVVAAILSPIAAQLIKLAISRKRELLADSSAVVLTRNPEGLATALEKISAYKKPVKNASGATAHLYISNPLGSKEFGGFLAGLFDTHPPLQERIKILRSME